jgi:hypothetical protein
MSRIAAVAKTSENGAKAPEVKKIAVSINPPKLATIPFRVVGTSPYVQHRFGPKVARMMRDKQEKGRTNVRGKRNLDPKDFKGLFEDAQYRSTEGWNGLPATSFRAAMIGACRLINLTMEMGKRIFWIEADGYDPHEMIPLIRFSKVAKGNPRMFEQALPNTNGGHDIRVRPMWEPGWEAIVRITFDQDLYSATDIGNLLLRAGLQCGIGEGRNASKKCAGCGWGAFEVRS